MRFCFPSFLNVLISSFTQLDLAELGEQMTMRWLELTSPSWIISLKSEAVGSSSRSRKTGNSRLGTGP